MVHTDRVVVADAPGASEIIAVLRVAVGPPGETDTARVMVPLKPLMLVRVTVDVAHEPAATVRLDGLAEMAKSGATVVKITLTECVRLAMVPLTGMVNEFPGPGKVVPANIVSVAVAVPFGLRATLVALSDQLLQPG